MLHEHGGLQTARILIHAATVSEGYTALWERGLDLTVEALIHDNPQASAVHAGRTHHLHAKADGIPISEVILTAIPSLFEEC